MAMLNNQMVIPIAVVYDTSNCFFWGLWTNKHNWGAVPCFRVLFYCNSEMSTAYEFQWITLKISKMYSVTLLYSVVIYEFPLNISRGHNIFPRGGRHWHDRRASGSAAVFGSRASAANRWPVPATTRSGESAVGSLRVTSPKMLREVGVLSWDIMEYKSGNIVGYSRIYWDMRYNRIQ